MRVPAGPVAHRALGTGPFVWSRGLSKPSCVRCSKAAVFDVAAFEGAERYGMLTPRDQRAVREGLLDAGVATL